MSVLIGDIVAGRIDPKVANTACNAGRNLLKVVELEYQYGGKAEAKDNTLTLAEGK